MTKTPLLIGITIALIIGISFVILKRPSPPSNSISLTSPQGTTMQPTSPQPALRAEIATITTSKGVIKVQLFADETPLTIDNLVKKAQSGFYQNLTFHRVEDWVVQGGDPLGNGTGGEKMPTELSERVFKEGSVGVARGGDIRVSNDAQFFICTKDCGFLTGQYTNFGEVTEGMDVVKTIQIGDTITSITVE